MRAARALAFYYEPGYLAKQTDRAGHRLNDVVSVEHDPSC